MKKILVAPSILSADFGRLTEELSAVEHAGADWIHVDVMDGHFVPNITIGPCVIAAVRRAVGIPFDVHLMIDAPERYYRQFIDAGSDLITFHVEAAADARGLIGQIKKAGARAGVSIKPKTPIETILPYLAQVDLVLVMTVEPGFGGQDFMAEVVPKISAIRRHAPEIDLSVDGGITEATARVVREAGANVLVAGSYVFKHSSYQDAIARLRGGR